MTDQTPRARPDRVLTNLIKLTGFGLVLHDYFTPPQGVSPETLAAAAFILSLASGLESFFERKQE